MSHALLSPSSAHRWLVCTPSAVAESQVPEYTSVYAEEGTLAHTLGELYIKKARGHISNLEFVEGLNNVNAHVLFKSEMIDHAKDYAHRCLTVFYACLAKDPFAVIYTERKFDLSKWVPDGFGTADCVIISEGHLYLFDLKYGQGVQVEADNNPQQMLYALGAYDCFKKLYDIEQVTMTIVQPRKNHYPEFTISIPDLLSWGEEVKKKAAIAIKGEGQHVPGEHCQFCKLQPVCKALHDEVNGVFNPERIPGTITNAEVGIVLKKAALIRDWLNSIYEYALAQSLAGVEFEGFKIVQAETKRRYKEGKENEIRNYLKSLSFLKEDFTNEKFIGLTEMTALLRTKKIKFEEAFKDWIEKPKGGPALVPLSHKGKLWNNAQIEDAFSGLPDTE